MAAYDSVQKQKTVGGQRKANKENEKIQSCVMSKHAYLKRAAELVPDKEASHR